MRIKFTLTIPHSGSWNGRWSGSKNEYSIIRNVLKRDLSNFKLNVNYYYNFGDGWTACIAVRPAEKRERATNKFYGYEWMIDSIIKYGKILD